VLIHHFGRLGLQLWPERGWRSFLNWLGDFRCCLLPILVLQFGDPQVQALDLLERQDVNFTQKLDDFRLGCVDACIVAVVVLGIGSSGLPSPNSDI
jgi:hypothetical protein